MNGQPKHKPSIDTFWPNIPTTRWQIKIGKAKFGVP